MEAVFKRLQKYNIRINPSKSKFLTNKINYCGYVIDRNGLHKAQDKIEVINKMHRPRNITEVRSFLGMLNYYSRFISNLSSILHPLNNLLHKNTVFRWSKDCETNI